MTSQLLVSPNHCSVNRALHETTPPMTRFQLLASHQHQVLRKTSTRWRWCLQGPDVLTGDPRSRPSDLHEHLHEFPGSSSLSRLRRPDSGSGAPAVTSLFTLPQTALLVTGEGRSHGHAENWDKCVEILPNKHVGGETGEQGTGIRWGSPTPACCQGRRLNVKHRCGWEEEEKHKVQPTAHLGSTCWKISNPLRSEIDLFRKKIKTLDMNQEVSDSCINDKHMKSRWSGSKGTRIVFWAHHDLWPPTALSKKKSTLAGSVARVHLQIYCIILIINSWNQKFTYTK